MRELTPQATAALRAAQPVVVLDVREPWEFARCQIAGSVHVPMNQIPDRLAELTPAATIVVVCHHGMRSLQVARYLSAQGFNDVANLTGGIDAWARTVDPSLATY